MVLAGDLMPSRALTVFKEPDYLALIDIVRSADVAFGNLETTVRHRHQGAPNFTQGTPMTTPPALLDDLKWMGFGLLSNANNHATDYGTGGVTAMLDHLRAARIPAAGSGANLAEARAPAYADTPAGRVAVVAATSFYRPWNRAADQRPRLARPARHQSPRLRHHIRDRPGRLRGVAAGQRRTRPHPGAGAPPRAVLQCARSARGRGRQAPFMGSQFRKGNRFHVATKANREDADANLRAIREARRQADFVIFSFHSHEFGMAGRLTAPTDVQMEEPAEFYVEFAKAAIDAGADIVAGHGPHLTLGIEVYKGRPIFYSLGNFIFQNDTVEVFPSESYGRFGLTHEATPADFSRRPHRRREARFSRLARILGELRGELRIPRPQACVVAVASARPRVRSRPRGARPSGAGARRGCAARARTGRGLVAKVRNPVGIRRRNGDDTARLSTTTP